MKTSLHHPHVISPRKQAVHELSEKNVSNRDLWIKKNAFFYHEDHQYFRFLVSEKQRVLELGCGNGDLLASLDPAYGMGIDYSQSMIDSAKNRHPNLTFFVGDIENLDVLKQIQGPFDAIILDDTIGDLEDVVHTFLSLHAHCTQDTRIVVAYHSPLWRPVLRLAEKFGLRMPTVEKNWLTLGDIRTLLNLADFEIIRSEWRQIMPLKLSGIGRFLNRYVATMPIIRTLCLRNYVIARSLKQPSPNYTSCSIVIPARNEKGNIENALLRLPEFCKSTEYIFVEGNSSDGTLEEMYRVQKAYPEKDIKVMVQDGIGKGDAVRKGFAHATGEVLIILDADLTTPPEQIPLFFETIASGKGEFINGTRLIYPREDEAMRFLNNIANHIFPRIFTWLLNQHFTDTLCGTKVISKNHYEKIVSNRAYFGDFDPFGDFDLIFGASKLNLKVVEVPVRYASRTYGETQISRFTHGWLLLKMIVFAFRRLKAF
ncbi:glycosyltransferase [Magnetovibrio blakemorei]|uniref:Glycosyl transferase n=1 Tax=Magnetovibrio blakemorei TaxID=28181 RepID=A0A1E5Q6J4_9PROT|nr:glycosyltransferase [Magnetovibrio blakemorei]OEJ66397.1 glycosyl transferase [Magnetovibrio blakemorei]